jgi:hypothetical protein
MLFALPSYQFPYIVMNRCPYLKDFKSASPLKRIDSPRVNARRWHRGPGPGSAGPGQAGLELARLLFASLCTVRAVSGFSLPAACVAIPSNYNNIALQCLPASWLRHRHHSCTCSPLSALLSPLSPSSPSAALFLFSPLPSSRLNPRSPSQCIAFSTQPGDHLKSSMRCGSSNSKSLSDSLSPVLSINFFAPRSFRI